MGEWCTRPVVDPLFYTPPIALLVGLVLGWGVGKMQGKRELQLFKEGLTHAQSLTPTNQAHAEGGPCWVKSQLPRGTP